MKRVLIISFTLLLPACANTHLPWQSESEQITQHSPSILHKTHKHHPPHQKIENPLKSDSDDDSTMLTKNLMA